MIALLLAAVCAVGPTPDARCTTGAVLHVTAKDVCVRGYAKKVRNVPASEKRAVMRAYGIDPKQHRKLEVDHLISLELGGSNDAANLWPEMQDPRPGFREKDKVEDWLHAETCAGRMTLDQAQEAIKGDWRKAYARMLGEKKR